MDVIFRNVATNDFYVVGVTDFSDEVTGSGANAARQYGLVVLGCPDEVVFAVEDGMGRFTV